MSAVQDWKDPFVACIISCHLLVPSLPVPVPSPLFELASLSVPTAANLATRISTSSMRSYLTQAEGQSEAVEMVDEHELTDRSNMAKEVQPTVKAVDNEGTASLEDQDGNLRATKSTVQDAEGMRRMGKDQQLVRHFRMLSITSFTAIATAAWEIGLFLLTPGLVDGGRSGLVYNTLWNFIGFGPIYLSMAELSSMAPIAGAQYHW